MRQIFLTGDIQIGKSTAIRRFLSARSELKVGGFLSIAGPIVDEGDGIYLVPAARQMPLDSRNLAFERLSGGQGRRFRVFPEVFNTVGTALLEDTEGCDLILMDEIGTVEECAQVFQRAILRRLDDTLPVLGVVQKRDGTFLQTVKCHPNVEVWTMTKENREQIYQDLLVRYAAL